MVTYNPVWVWRRKRNDMELFSTQSDEDRQPQLRRGDWIKAALEALIADGVEAVQITTLSRNLGVTRGSFYWHFENREALLTALLAEWRAKNSGMMAEALTKSPTLQDGILDLFAVWVDHEKYDPSLDQAVRDWARRSGDICVIVEKEDNNRVAAIAAFYERFGYEKINAFIRARVIYFTQLSYYQLNIDEPMAERVSYLAAYFRCFTGREIDDEAAVKFLRRVSPKIRQPDETQVRP